MNIEFENYNLRLNRYLFAGILALLVCAAFPSVVVGVNSFFYRDFGVLAYPTIYHHKQAFLSGELPLWNPLSHCGVPFLAQWGTMTLYPLSLIFLLAPLPWSLNFFCLFHLFLGGLGMYLVALRWSDSRIGASVAGVAYSFNGITLSCLMWPNYIAALGWLPWVIMASEGGLRAGGRKLMLALVLLAIQLTAGVPEISGLTLLVIIAVAITEIARAKDLSGKILFRLATIIAAPVIVVSAQILPFIQLALNSQRDFGFSTDKWSMPGWGWANFFVPMFHFRQTYQNTFFQTDQAFLTSYYIGLGTSAVALIGASCVRNARSVMLVALTIFGLVFALGSNGYIYDFVRTIFPPLGLIRYPVKYVLIVAFTAPMLSAIGVQWLLQKKDAAAKTLITITALFFIIITAILWFAFKYPFEFDQWELTRNNTVAQCVYLILFLSFFAILRRGGKAGLIGLFLMLSCISVDSLRHIPNFHPVIASDHFTIPLWNAAVKAEPPKFGQARVFISPEAEERLLRSTVADWSMNFTGKRLALWSNLHLLEQIPKVNGASTLQLRRQKKVESTMYSTNRVDIEGLLDFLGVQWITARGKVVEWEKRTNAMPLVTVGQKPFFASDEEILAGIFSTNFNPREVVYLEQSEQAELTPLNEVIDQTQVLNATYTTHKITAEVEAKNPSVVVIAQSYYEPWKAFIDGKPARLLRANYAFQAVPVPAGRHIVIVVYRDIWFLAGLIISLISLALLACFIKKKSRT